MMYKPDDWASANKDRGSWGTKNLKSDMDFSHCLQSEITDEYGTPEEISNACAFFKAGLGFAVDSIHMLVKIQKGMSDEQVEGLGIEKLKREIGKIGTPIMIANHVHQTLDWMRATRKRKWDGRPLNSQEHILEYVMKGIQLNHATHLHYDERAEQ